MILGFAEAGAFTLVTSIEMGMSVLLFWYGGSVVMSEDDRLSLGSLVSFQIYWFVLGSVQSSQGAHLITLGE